MWKAYFPKAHVVGVDVHDKSGLAEPRIDIVRADQSDADSLADVNRRFGPFDVIVDDGSHVSAHVRTTFETLFPLLAADGVYAIEDLQTSYWPEYGGAVDLGDGTTSMALVKSLVDGLNYEEHLSTVEPSYTDTHVVAVHCYHNLVVVQKGRNAEGTLKRALLKDRYLTG
jgi:cephalosporin hydroxylase